MICECIRDVVSKAWKCSGNHSPIVKLPFLLHNTRKALNKWKYSMGHLFKKRQQINDRIYQLQLLEVQQSGLSDHQHMQLLALLRDFKKSLYMQKFFQRQKACTAWPIEGDTNPKYFHGSTILKRRSNRIYTLKDSQVN